jgi:hypothetical protein
MSKTENILATYDEAGPDLARAGRDWYLEANDIAKRWAKKSGLTYQRVAQVISLLSPSVAWDINLRDAHKLIFATEEERWSMKVSTYGPQKDKAIGVIKGTYDFHFTGYNWKTYNFAWCIADPTHDTSVTVDRHAYWVANRKEEKITDKRYRETANAYREVAKLLNLLPLQVQAITWLQRINEKRV